MFELAREKKQKEDHLHRDGLQEITFESRQLRRAEGRKEKTKRTREVEDGRCKRDC